MVPLADGAGHIEKQLNTMVKKDYIAFKPFERQLNSAKHTNYARFEHNEFLAFGEAVKGWRGTELTKNEKSCRHCLLTLCKKVADEYFKYKDSPWGKRIDNEGNEEIGSTPAGD